MTQSIKNRSSVRRIAAMAMLLGMLSTGCATSEPSTWLELVAEAIRTALSAWVL